MLKRAEFTAITADFWTSVATVSYLTVTYHFLNEQWKMKSVMLGTLPLSESHAATNIAAWIKELVAESGLKSDKVVAFVHDSCKSIENAGNMYPGGRTWMAIFRMCRAYLAAMCEFWSRDTS